MTRRKSAAVLWLAVVLLTRASAPSAMQGPPLTVVSAAPSGEVKQLSDANEIRIIFSEPMVALGRVPSNPSVPWVTIAPAMKGTFRWSGTTVLMFTPDPAAPLPYATHYAVTVTSAAESAAGHRLSAPYHFEFTTPTVKLMSEDEEPRWYRKNGRFDGPLVIAMRFNQPVHGSDIVKHLQAHYVAHDWDIPVLSADVRRRMTAADPNGMRLFDTKVAATAKAAGASGLVSVRIASDWDKKRFPPEDDLVVLETTTAPPPQSGVQLTFDDRLPSPGGREVPGQNQTLRLDVESALFVNGTHCATGCDPSGWNPIMFTADVAAAAFRPALSVREVTDPAHEQPVARPAQPPARTSTQDLSSDLNVEDAGFDRQPPAKTWLLSLDPKLQSADGQTLGYPWMGLVLNWHESAFTSFGDGHGVWEKDGGPQLPFYARNFTNVIQWLVPVAPADLMPRILALQKDNFSLTPPGAGTTRRLGVTPDVVQSHGLDLSSVLSPQGTGLAWVAVRPGAAIDQSKVANKDARATLVQVTNLGISVKDSPQSTLVFVTRLDTGAPVPDADISIVNLANKEVWHGTSSRDGLALAPALPLRQADRDWEMSFIVTARKDGDVAYVVSNWNEGIEPWEFGADYNIAEATDILRGAVFTDRGIYKPGETIHLKTIVRADTPTGVRLLPAGASLEVVVTDSRNREVDTRTVKVNRWSSIDWTWAVPAEATLGRYAIDVRVPRATPRPPVDPNLTDRANNATWLHEISGGFTVTAYRRPDFRVDATLTTAAPTAGATLHASLDARYLFGSAMAKRPVQWSIRREPTFDVPQAIYEHFPEEQYAFGYEPDRSSSRPEPIVSRTATLDANGKFTIDQPTERKADFAYVYTFEGDVEDVSRQHIAGRATIVVHPAPWYVGLTRPPYFVEASTGATVGVVAVDHLGKTAAGVKVTVSLIREQWTSVRRAQGHGFYEWETERKEIPAGQWTVTSASDAVPLTMPTAEGGSYLVRAIATDADGRSTRTELHFYALGAGYTAWKRYDSNRIELTPEHKTWKPGDTARVMIQSPWETATALLTVEREGVRSYKRFDLKSTQDTVDVPITEADIPNLFVSVLLIKGRTSKDPGADGSDPGKPAFRLGYTELNIENASKRLAVKVAADREEYRPTNVANVAVTVNDAQGKGAAGEVTLWAVDYGVLSLTAFHTPDLLESVYQHKALQVMTEDSRERIVSRRVLTPKGDADGGGGGAESGLAAMRKDFTPLAFWLGSIETDATGHATTKVTLPDSLTTYRIMAVADDASSRFGSADAEIRVSKPVTLLPAFPRFLTLGDKATFGAVVTNTKSDGGPATVTVKSLDPAMLTFDGNASTTVQLAGGASAPVRFEATAMATGTARVQMTVALGGDADAFETTLPISVTSRTETTAAFGDTDSMAREPLHLPAGVSPAIGGLQIDLASTALVGLGEGARYLVDYPYGCAEQKTSSALALSLAADLGGAFKMSALRPEDLRTRATSLLRDLPRYQCQEGGFTLWPGACGSQSAYLTSYVLHVMHVASTLGISAEPTVVNRALAYLDKELKAAAPTDAQYWPAWAASQAFSVKVLVEYGHNEDSNITRLVGVTDRLPVFALSYLADALAGANQRTARYQDTIRRLTNALRVEGDQAHVQEADDPSLAWLWDSNVRATAVVLEGFVQRKDDAAMVQRMVRWLLAARKNGRWDNTQDNATALESLVAYYRAFEADAPDMTATVALGSATIGTASFRGRSTVAQSVTLAMPDLLRAISAGTTGDLDLSRAGTGRLYYTARLQYAASGPQPAVDQGLHIDRTYEHFVETGTSPAATSFNAGDLVRVTLTVIVPKEARYVAVNDPLPAGFEPVDGSLATTAADLARDASVSGDQADWWTAIRRGGFDHVEKGDDQVRLFAMRLGEGRHEFSYLVRATTGGTFQAAGAWAEQMYAPEVFGRTATITVVVK